MTVAALSFDPVFLYLALGLSGVVAFSRLLLAWGSLTLWGRNCAGLEKRAVPEKQTSDGDSGMSG